MPFSVVLLTPRRTAAHWGPPITPLEAQGTGNQFLSRFGFPQDQYRRIRGRYGFGLLQDAFQNRILADDLVKVVRRLELLFEIMLLFRHSVLQLRYVSYCQLIVRFVLSI